MDVVMLSRLQFAVAVFFHFIFVPLTLGLSVLLAVMETIYVRTGNEQYKRMAKFWGKLFLINFTLGVVTGITLEFQFGTNWSRYSEFVGDIFGSLLAIEATLAFFLESTFIAVWHFGWEKVSKKTHLFAIWMVALAGNLSAVWIILANGWMQHPVGFSLEGGKAILTDFFAVIANGFAWSQFFHTIFASWMLAGFFVMGVAAWHLLRKNEVDFFTRSFKLASVFTLVLAVCLAAQGHHHGTVIAREQPAKLAAMESHWETGKNAPMYLLVIPDEANRKNLLEAIPIPGMLSFLAHGDFNAEVKGLNDAVADDFAAFKAARGYKTDADVTAATLPGAKPGDPVQTLAPLTKESAYPPVLPTFLSFRIMVGLGALFLLMAVGAFLWRNDIAARPCFARALIWLIPLPYIAIMAGWTVAEVGRQPWIVYKLMATNQAVSPVPGSSIGLSLAAFVVIYTILGVLDIYLLRKNAVKGPAA